jgi:hypothetical protein
VAILLSVPGIEATEEEKLGFPLAEKLNELLVSKMQDFNGEFLGSIESLVPEKKGPSQFISSAPMPSDLPKRLTPG